MKLSGSNGGNGGEIRERALAHLSRELAESKLPSVLSSYMNGKNLPDAYRGIDPYIRSVRSKLIEDAGGELTQLQMVMLDGICETLLVLKYISTFIGEDPGNQIIGYNRLGVPTITDVAVRGFGSFHTILDKKIKQFHDMTAEQKNALSPQEVHRRAIMGEHLPTGRPLNTSKDMRLKENRDRENKEMAEQSRQEHT
jgi:hypothetical protein